MQKFVGENNKTAYYQIKKELERRQIKAPFGGSRWHQGVIQGMLTNEKYMGDALLQKYYTVDFLSHKRKKNKGEVPQYYIEGDHEPIISKEMFKAMQNELAERQENIKKYVGTNMITRKLVCVIKAYKHSKIITEFSEDLWNGLLDKCLVFHDHVEFVWK